MTKDKISTPKGQILSDEHEKGESFVIRLMQAARLDTLTALSQWSGIHYTTLNHYVNNTRFPSDRTLFKLHHKHNLNLDWLRTGKGEPFLPDSTSGMSKKRLKVEQVSTIGERGEIRANKFIINQEGMGVLSGLSIEILPNEVILRPNQNVDVDVPTEIRIPLNTVTVR